MKNLLKQIENGKIFVGDGAMGTMLMERGLEPGQPPESFSLTHLEILEEIAMLYLDAGAEIIQTNTFGGSPLNLALYALEEKTEDINKNAVLAVKKTVGDQAFVSGSCGPSNKILKPYGETEPEEVYNSYERQIRTLISEGVDIICIETMIDLSEAKLAIKAAKTVSTTIPIMATMTFNLTPKGFYTVMGNAIKDAATELEQAGADIIGSNCGNGIENMIKIAKEFKEYSGLPLIIQSNAGVPERKADKSLYPETPEFMADKVQELLDIGVSVIGGCCGTTPAHIKAIRQMVNISQKRGKHD